MPLERSEDCFILFPSFCPRLDHPSTAEEKQNVNSEAKQDLGFSYTGCSLMAVQPCFVISMAATKRDCNVGVCLIRFCSPSFLDYVTYVTMRYVSSCSIALVEFTAMDNYRGLCMGVLWKVCLPQASFCRRYVVSRYPNLGSGRNYSEQRMSGMSQYSVRSNTGLLVWILAFYIFWLTVLNGDQFIFQHSSSVHNGFTPWGASHQGGKRMRECSEAFPWDRTTLQQVLQPESACFFCFLKFLKIFVVWIFGFRNVWVYNAKMQFLLQCNHQSELVWSARMLLFSKPFPTQIQASIQRGLSTFYPDLSSSLILVTTTTTNLQPLFDALSSSNLWINFGCIIRVVAHGTPSDEVVFPVTDGSLVGWKDLQQCKWQNTKHVTRQEAEVNKLISAPCSTVKLYEWDQGRWQFQRSSTVCSAGGRYGKKSCSKTLNVQLSHLVHRVLAESFRVQILSLGLRWYLWSGTQNYGTFL